MDCPTEAHHIYVNSYKIAMLNRMVPKGFKFDVLEQVTKSVELAKKKTNGLANHNKRAEIQNEVKQ